MKRLVLGTIFTVALMVGLSAPVRAEVYVGASFLSNDAEFSSAYENFSFNTDDSGWKIFAGWNFFKFLGIEAAYRDLGSHSQSIPGAMLDTDITAADISARGILPLGKVIELFGKVGYANIQLDGSFSGASFSSIDQNDWDLMYGVGLGVNLGKHFQIRGEWEIYDVDDDLNSLSIGAAFKF